MELLSGGDMLLRALADEGVECIFGYPGGAALHIYDALFRQQKVKHVLVRHEQAATHAADGYARSTGRTGVVLVTSGPGATNAITGIATAYMDSIPMVVISGQVPSDKIGEDAFQETDMVGISRPIVKHSFMVQNPEDIPVIVKKAFHIATTGRPGPVVIDVPKDATDPARKFEYHYPESVKMRSYSVPSKGHTGQIKKAVELLLGAKRPIIYAGGGVVQGNGDQLLTELARKLGFPVGMFDESIRKSDLQDRFDNARSRHKLSDSRAGTARNTPFFKCDNQLAAVYGRLDQLGIQWLCPAHVAQGIPVSACDFLSLGQQDTKIQQAGPGTLLQQTSFTNRQWVGFDGNGYSGARAARIAHGCGAPVLIGGAQ